MLSTNRENVYDNDNCNKQQIAISNLSLLIFGYIRYMNNIYIPLSIKQLILSFYPKPKDDILIIKSTKNNFKKWL